MHTILELINLSTDYLQKKGIESSRLNAELLLADILQCKRLELYLQFDKPLREPEVQKYRAYLKRRSAFEPLQYILGKTSFYGHDIKVTPNVLIPRPETEILIDVIFNSFPKPKPLRILDIGTGSGNIVIALTKHFANASAVAIDISLAAISLAKENAEANEVASQITFIEADAERFLQSGTPEFDLIVSNPPYVSLAEYQTLQKEIVDFEPKEAVTDMKDGYTFYKMITREAKQRLKNEGQLFFEIGHGQEKTVKSMFFEHEYEEVFAWKDYQRIPRVVRGIKP